MKPLGVVLAGGLSRRMEGENKSLLALGGKPLIMRVAERLARQTDELIVNANFENDIIQSLGIPVVPDTISGFAGPLAGVLAGMIWARDNLPKTEFIVTAATDTPFFPQDLVDRFVQTASMHRANIVLASSKGRSHPVFGLWHISLADDLERFLVKEENRKVLLFVERYSNAVCDFPSLGEHDPFFNVNTPLDYELAQTILESDDGPGVT